MLNKQWTVAVALFLVGVLFLGIPGAQAACSNVTLNSAYGFVASGLAIDGKDVTHFLLVGTIVFDGQGNVAGATTESFNGSIEPGITFAGTYTVNANCTGSMTINGTHPGTTDGVIPPRTDQHHLNFVIVDQAKEVQGIFADQTNVIGDTMKRQ